MMHDVPREGRPWPTEHRAPTRRASFTAGNAVAIAAIAGFAVGLILVWILDKVAGGPGIGVMFQ